MKFYEVARILASASVLTVLNCEIAKENDGSELAILQHQLKCKYVNKTGDSEDTLLEIDKVGTSEDFLNTLRKASRVCLPKPCDHLNAYSGYIPVDENKNSSYLFFLHIKSEEHMKKPLLLWLQGGPGKSSLFGQFLENGPLGIDPSGNLYYREHTLLKEFNIIYLDQPAGSGYSFDKNQQYPFSLDQASTHVIRFLEQFLKIFREYDNRDFYIAGESYGARSAIGVAHKVMKKEPSELSLKLKGVMLGVGFLFPLLDIINSTDSLYYTALLDECRRNVFSQRFDTIQHFAVAKDNLNATILLSRTVLNLRGQSEKSLFGKLTGFDYQGSIIVPRRPKEVLAYYHYANSTAFKKIIHVASTRTLDGTRRQMALQLAVKDFFRNHSEVLLHVLNNLRVLFYTAQLDDVFPAIKIEQAFMELQWRGSEIFKTAPRVLWYRENNSSLELRGYIKDAGAVMYANVLFGGHHVSMDCSSAVSELYCKFLKFPKASSPVPSHEEIPAC